MSRRGAVSDAGGGWQHLVPAAARKPNYENVREAALIVWRGRRVLMRQCQAQERWAGLWDFPICRTGRDRKHG